MDQAEVEGDDPLEWVEVECSLEAGNRRHVLLLAEEAHADVVPELARVRVVHGSDTVL